MVAVMKKVAMITGAGSGIGRAVSVALGGKHFALVLAGRRQLELEQTREMCPRAAEVVVAPTDVASPEQVDELFRIVEERLGRLDLLINNAGINVPAVPIEELTFAQWKGVVDVNLTGAFLCAQGAFRLMKKQQPRGGRIINNGSISAHVPRPNSAPYTASKHGITGLTKSLALDGRAFDIACGQIDIGNAATEMTDAMARGVLQADGSLKPEARLDLRHVTDAFLYLAELPLDANVPFLTVMATKMPFMGRG